MKEDRKTSLMWNSSRPSFTHDGWQCSIVEAAFTGSQSRTLMVFLFCRFSSWYKHLPEAKPVWQFFFIILILIFSLTHFYCGTFLCLLLSHHSRLVNHLRMSCQTVIFEARANSTIPSRTSMFAYCSSSGSDFNDNIACEGNFFDSQHVNIGSWSFLEGTTEEELLL